MKELSLKKLENLEGGKFWGKSCGARIFLPGGACIRSCAYYALWAPVATWVSGC